MFYSPKLYIRDWWVLTSGIWVILAQIFMWAYIFINIHPGDDQFLLHYNIIFGVDLAGEWWKILYLPISGLLVVLTNFLISYYFYGEERFMSRLLANMAAFFHVLLLVATVLIVGLNI